MAREQHRAPRAGVRRRDRGAHRSRRPVCRQWQGALAPSPRGNLSIVCHFFFSNASAEAAASRRRGAPRSCTPPAPPIMGIWRHLAVNHGVRDVHRSPSHLYAASWKLEVRCARGRLPEEDIVCAAFDSFLRSSGAKPPLVVRNRRRTSDHGLPPRVGRRDSTASERAIACGSKSGPATAARSSGRFPCITAPVRRAQAAARLPTPTSKSRGRPAPACSPRWLAPARSCSARTSRIARLGNFLN